MDPFPGSMSQIFQAKSQDDKPEFPPEFPAVLKDLVYTGWSKKPRERPEIEKLSSALCLLLKQEEEKNLPGD